MASPAAPRGAAFPAVVAVAGVVVWYLWTNQGKTHAVSLEDAAFSAKSWEPYAWWATHRPDAAIRHYPQEVGPNCLALPLANQDGALSTSARNNEESPYG